MILENFYVRQNFRNAGVGRQLFEATVHLSSELGAAKVDFHDLGWNPAKEFYRKMGAIDRNESQDWKCFSCPL